MRLHLTWGPTSSAVGASLMLRLLVGTNHRPRTICRCRKESKVWRSPRCSRIRADALRDCKVTESSTSTIHIVTRSYIFLSLSASLVIVRAVNPSLTGSVQSPQLCHNQTPCRMRSVKRMGRTSHQERTKTSSLTTKKLRRGLTSVEQPTTVKVPMRRERSSSSKIYALSRFALYVYLLQ